ncbi:collagen alpha-1(I) chain-like [Protopterus annectens]|uniref:collagen alpha-1(I) chain-like n=1 Tax=Protopterus annectens TaxID=7888 RepID=UPI001CF9DC7B|nr:collagen alpha-1(I) chain-like [Protopterus annectens]
MRADLPLGGRGEFRGAGPDRSEVPREAPRARGTRPRQAASRRSGGDGDRGALDRKGAGRGSPDESGSAPRRPGGVPRGRPGSERGPPGGSEGTRDTAPPGSLQEIWGRRDRGALDRKGAGRGSPDESGSAPRRPGGVPRGPARIGARSPGRLRGHAGHGPARQPPGDLGETGTVELWIGKERAAEAPMRADLPLGGRGEFRGAGRDRSEVPREAPRARGTRPRQAASRRSGGDGDRGALDRKGAGRGSPDESGSAPPRPGGVPRGRPGSERGPPGGSEGTRDTAPPGSLQEIWGRRGPWSSGPERSGPRKSR